MALMRASLPKETGLTAKDIRECFDDRSRQITLLATCGDEVAGFAIGFFHVFEDHSEIVAIGDPNIFHLCVNIVPPKFQGRGIGTMLIKERIAYAKKHGARTCTSFATAGASLHNLKKHGGRTIALCENFQGSGDTHHLVRIDI